MGDERKRLGARSAAGIALAVCCAGEGGAGAVPVSDQRRRETGVPRDARGCVSASVPGEDSELLQLALLGHNCRLLDVGGPGADVYPRRAEVASTLFTAWRQRVVMKRSSITLPDDP